MVLGVDAATVYRLVNRLRPLMEKAADPGLKTCLADILIDATETPTVRPVKKGKQKKHYSDKKKHHTLKN